MRFCRPCGGDGVDLLSEIAGQTIVFQQDAAFVGLAPALGLALGVRVIRCAVRVIHLLIFRPISQLAGDVAGAVFAEQTWLAPNCRLIVAQSLQRKIQRNYPIF